ncbi:GAF domain-containing protein [Lysobacter sp. MMG2]|uniref:GAF domain-containing protein n=1 Tax=Lysobacter sp. MMG2 TaxID=2801338 RepID=UPI001C236C05|nr:GAF domain-containing protein [Lysobacter sp. MMG2]MBU8977641.1 GAF domain-containing protein [Lysobacter sp. MMG2]
MNVNVTTEAEVCAREPIHLSGAIQPHGFLISCSWPDWTVRHVSANVAELLDLPPRALLGTSLREHVDGSFLEAIADALRFIEPGLAAQRVATVNLGRDGALCDVSTHLHQGLVHIEIEPQTTADGSTGLTANAMIGRIAGQDPAPGFFQQVASLVRELTDYDRVMVYRFRADDAGEVIAEARSDEVEPYLGLRYPASDIPAQARHLYLLNRLRVIPDAQYAPVPIEPALHVGGAPLDLTHHALRSVSPVHVEYLRNMGVGASMSISIVSGGRLWGLIACHHRTPRPVPPGMRATADLFGMYVSMRVAGHEQATTMALFDQSQQLGDVLRESTLKGQSLADVLPIYLRVVARLLDADGVLMILGSRQASIGPVPGGESLSELCAWGAARAGAVAMTHRREDWRSQSHPADGLAGVLAMAFGRDGDGLYCFRKEQIEEVTWAGTPHKATVPTDDGTRIAPRRSFAAWRETVRGQSVQWSDSDRRIAERLYDILIDLHRRSTVNADEQQTLRQRQNVREESERLSRLAAMLGDMQHLDEAQTRYLAEQIAELELHMRSITHRGDREDNSGDR